MEYLEYTQVPYDVKVVYLRKIEGKQIVQNDIKKFQNKLTVDTRGRQQNLNFVEFPKASWTYIIYVDGTYFWYIGQQQNYKYLVSWFKKSLQPMHEWNAMCFYYLYRDLEI